MLQAQGHCQRRAPGQHGLRRGGDVVKLLLGDCHPGDRPLVPEELVLDHVGDLSGHPDYLHLDGADVECSAVCL